jgi:ASC-1-like (ASCH) protein
MEHVAIMRKSWGLTRKVLTGQKSVESRWYKVRYAPWNRIGPGDTVYFKDSGEPITVKAEVEKVTAFSGLTPGRVRGILHEYAGPDGLEKHEIPRFFEMFRDKRYCMLIFLRNPERVEPFSIDKKGFGAMSSWIVVDDVSRIRKG